MPRNSFGIVQVEQLSLHFRFSQQFITLDFPEHISTSTWICSSWRIVLPERKGLCCWALGKKGTTEIFLCFLMNGITEYSESSESQQSTLIWSNRILPCHIHWFVTTRGGTGCAPMSWFTAVLCTNDISAWQQKVHPWNNNVLLSRKSQEETPGIHQMHYLFHLNSP